MGCAVCEVRPELSGRDLARDAGIICRGCLAKLFARTDGNGLVEAEQAWDDAPTWFPLVRKRHREERWSLEERLSDLRELAARSRPSRLPPEPDSMLDATPSLRAAIQNIELFAVPVDPEPPAPSQWFSQEKPRRGRLLDRAELVAVIVCSALLSWHFLDERPPRLSGNTRLAATAVARPALAYAAARATLVMMPKETSEAKQAARPKGVTGK